METRSTVKAITDKNVKKTYHPKLVGKSRLKDIYRMEAKVRGQCIIFANSKFLLDSKLDPLPGYQLDADLLERVFTQLHFDVNVFRNCPAQQILNDVRQYSLNYDNHDAFVVIILTHGNQNKIFGTDFISYAKTPGAVITEEQLLSVVSNRNCSSLVGKPKLFFIQACRGGKP
jgi:hypothetical protein